MCMSASLNVSRDFFYLFCFYLLYHILVYLCVFTLFYFINFICPFLIRKI